MTRRLVGALAGALVSCASASGTAPHDMSAAAHEAAAAGEEKAGMDEWARYDPNAWRGRDCRGIRLGELRPVCWSEPRNPTARYLDEAERRRTLAERHRAASKALRDAEAIACGEVAVADRDESPFLRREDILWIEPVREHERVAGAAVAFRRVPGLDATVLRDIASCHAARNAVLGHARSESSWCPLAIPGISIDSTERAGGVVLLITSPDDDRAAEVLRRARAAVSAREDHAEH